MSELINNREHRQETLKGIIRDLHAGVSVDDIKGRFSELLDQVGASEIAEIEQALINEGLPVEEVQKLCDVHVAVFKESLDKQMAQAIGSEKEESDPLQDLKDSNIKISDLITTIRGLLDKISEADAGSDIKSLLTAWEVNHERLLAVDQHYSKKENILFPYLERYGISGPPSVMWATHDEIRAALKDVTAVINNFIEAGLASPQLAVEIGNIVLPALNSVSEMVYKEENILFPLCKDTFTEDEWKEIEAQFKDPMAAVYKKKGEEGSEAVANTGAIELDVGVLTPEQINLILKHLPIDMTFVDEKDEVAYFSLGPERIFERARAVIGRKVQFCHPPASMGVVEQILDDFRSGRRDSADFWINMKDMVVYIRYFAVRDETGKYRGTLEVSQNITDIQKITGEKRILDYDN